MATSDQPSHPWRLNGAVELPVIDPGGGRRPPSQVSRENAAATEARIIGDEHRSDVGRCVRCDTMWPCVVAAVVRRRSTS